MKTINASKSVRIFGLYLILIPGLVLIFAPQLILDLFQLSYGEELWLPSMVSFFAMVIGIYYFFWLGINCGNCMGSQWLSDLLKRHS